MSTLDLAPITNGPQTISKNIQDALSLVGENQRYDALHLAAGNYLIDDSIKKCAYSILGINSGSDICGDIDKKGNPLTVLQLMFMSTDLLQ